MLLQSTTILVEMHPNGNRNGNGSLLMTKSSSNAKHDQYDPDWFVDRDEEVAQIEKLVTTLRSTDNPGERTISFSGARGQGKSWLSLHLHRTVLPKLKVKSLYFAFDKNSQPDDNDDSWYFRSWLDAQKGLGRPEDVEPYPFAQDILLSACQRIGARTTIGATLAERASELVQVIRSASEQRRENRQLFVFILDSVSELPEPLSISLEHSMLASVAGFSNVLIIMTGRLPFPLWSSPRLRIDAISVTLRPLTKGDVRDLLQRRAPNELGRLDELWTQSQGNPGAIRQMLIKPDSAGKADLNSILDNMLDLFEAEADRKKAREAIEALCLLDSGFREEEMKILLAAYRSVSEESITDEEIDSIRNLLFERQLLNWDREKAGLVIDRGIGPIAAQYLLVERKALWLKLHQSAEAMYRDYADRYERHRETYQILADFHRAAIASKNSPSVVEPQMS